MPPRKKVSAPRRGGALLGQGGFGCAFKPPLPCDNAPPPDASLVGKVYAKGQEASSEYGLAQQIKQFDPTGRYFILPKGMCAVQRDKLQHTKCRFARQYPQPAYQQTLMPYGGMMLLDYVSMYKNLSMTAMLMLLRNVAHGMFVLETNGWVHGDIKCDNIVVLDNVSPPQAKLIDLSFAQRADHYCASPTAAFYNFNTPYEVEFDSVNHADYTAMMNMSIQQKEFIKKYVAGKRDFQASETKLLKEFMSYEHANVRETFLQYLWQSSGDHRFKVDAFGFGTVLLDALPHVQPDANEALYHRLIYKCLMPHPGDRMGNSDILKAIDGVIPARRGVAEATKSVGWRALFGKRNVVAPEPPPSNTRNSSSASRRATKQPQRAIAPSRQATKQPQSQTASRRASAPSGQADWANPLRGQTSPMRTPV